MKLELDQQLCEKYPKIFKDRNKSIQESCMAWGFDIGDGWYNIIDLLCGQIQGHIQIQRGQRAKALKYNRALARALKGDTKGLVNYYSVNGNLSEYGKRYVEEAIKNQQFRSVPEKINQVVAEQVKEKFGTLRFYYRGGDSFIHGMIQMAESISSRMCDECGAPAQVGGQGWLSTRCTSCREILEQKRQQSLAAYNAQHEQEYKKIKEQ